MTERNCRPLLHQEGNRQLEDNHVVERAGPALKGVNLTKEKFIKSGGYYSKNKLYKVIYQKIHGRREVIFLIIPS